MPTDDQVTTGESAHAEYLNNVDLEPEEPRRSEEEEVDCGEIETMRLSNLRNSRLLEELLAKLNPTPTTINDDGSCVYRNTDGTTVTVTGGWEALEADDGFPVCDWEEGDALRDEMMDWTVDDEFPPPAKFAALEVPPPKPSIRLGWEYKRHHAEHKEKFDWGTGWWMMRPRNNGRKPRYTDKRRRQRISVILHAHVELTQKEWFLFDQENGLQMAFRDHMEDERFDDEMLELMEDEEAAMRWSDLDDDEFFYEEEDRRFAELLKLESRYRQEIKAGQELLAANRDNFVPGLPTLKEILAMEQESANRGDDD